VFAELAFTSAFIFDFMFYKTRLNHKGVWVMVNTITANKVRAILKAEGLQNSGLVIKELDLIVKEILKRAAINAKMAQRKTVMARDI